MTHTHTNWQNDEKVGISVQTELDNWVHKRFIFLTLSFFNIDCILIFDLNGSDT